LELFAGHQFAGVLEQCRQHLKRLLLQADSPPALRELAGSKVDLEDAEA